MALFEETPTYSYSGCFDTNYMEHGHHCIANHAKAYYLRSLGIGWLSLTTHIPTYLTTYLPTVEPYIANNVLVYPYEPS